MYDVTVIGGGPAGLSAAMYLGRKRLKAALFEGEVFGGQMARTGFIDDYPGVLQIDGPGLTGVMKKQAELMGAEIKSEEITEIEIAESKSFRVKSAANNSYECRAVIVATGVEVRKLGIPGEDEFAGRGVSYCAVCDAPLFRNKAVAVVGGGNSAVSSAQLLSKYASKVYVVHRRKEFRADPVLLKAVLGTPNIESVLNSVVEKIGGTRFVEKAVLKDVETGKTSELTVGGIFVEVGGTPLSHLIRGLGVEVNGGGYIKVDKSQATGVPGIFAAGDVTDFALKQIATAVGQGAQAAVSAADYLRL